MKLMNLNLVKLSFIIKTLGTGVLGGLINFFEPYIPVQISKLFRHGKFHAKVNDTFLDKCEVPKRWFKHFYAFAGPWSTFVLGLIYYRYFYNGALSNSMISVIEILMGKPVQSLVPAENILLAMTIFTIHCWKRYYESHYVSIFSDNKMNFSIYLLGLSHYNGAILSIIGESQDLTKGTQIDLLWSRLTWLEYSCAALFLLSTYLQFRCNIILSNLRKDKKGNVVTTSYKVPKGELFDYISAPLQFTEIILYITLNIILREASTFYYVTLWVLVNQIECAYLSHEWSIKTFKDYPKNRKIIIPFIF